MPEGADSQKPKVPQVPEHLDLSVLIPRTAKPDVSTWEGKLLIAREAYADIYEKNPIIWKLEFKERFKYLINKLEAKGITFTNEEKTLLDVALQRSTVKMKVLQNLEKDDLSKPDPLIKLHKKAE